jgi:transcriptional regulator of arginine metabolism
MDTVKFNRQAKLLEIIETEDIETQEELSARLRAFGYNTTQATISRDIKELRLVKSPTGRGRYKYALPATEGDPVFSDRFRTIFCESVISYEQAQNIVVLKTMPGVAMAAASALDSMRLPDIVGSLAGDDTAFLVLKDNPKAEAFCRRLQTILA